MTEPNSIGDLSGDDRRTAEQGAENSDRARDISLLESLEAEMDEVQAALDRLEEGTYGKCALCGHPIGDERLQAFPATRYCVDHSSPDDLRDAPRGQTPEPGT